MPSSEVAARRYVTLPKLLSQTLQDTLSLSFASWHVALAYCLWSGMFSWALFGLPDGLWMMNIVFGLVGAYLYCLYSLHLFARLVRIPELTPLAALKLVYATLLFLFLGLLTFSAFVLFFTMVGASIGIVSGSGDPAATTDIIEQMRSGGTFWPIFVLFVVSVGLLFWFFGRLFLFTVATAATGQIHIFRTWAWTKPKTLLVVLSVSGLVFIPNLAWYFVSDNLAGQLGLTQAGAFRNGVFEFGASVIALPLIWLNHALAVNLFRQLAPVDLVQATTLSAFSPAISVSE